MVLKRLSTSDQYNYEKSHISSYQKMQISTIFSLNLTLVRRDALRNEIMSLQEHGTKIIKLIMSILKRHVQTIFSVSVGDLIDTQST